MGNWFTIDLIPWSVLEMEKKKKKRLLKTTDCCYGDHVVVLSS